MTRLPHEFGTSPACSRYTRRVRIVVAPDSFKESIGAIAASRAIARGLLAARPGADIDRCPVGDGGEGTLDAVLDAIGGETHAVQVSGPLGNPVQGVIGLFPERNFAWVECASATGLALLPSSRRDPGKTSSTGVGELITAALDTGARRIVVGVGGSATNDGGCGMAQALGVTFHDSRGNEISEPLCGERLVSVASIDLSRRDARLGQVEVIAACDVSNPLTGVDGASLVYAPQKGASRERAVELDAALQHLVAVVQHDLGIDIDSMPGAGAGGGLGAGLLAFADAKLVSGIDIVLDLVGFDELVAGADLCITGEGRIDGQSVYGKACMGVARAAQQCGVHTIALVGSAGDDADRCLAAGLRGYVVIAPELPPEQSMADAERLLEQAAALLARQFTANDRTMT